MKKTVLSLLLVFVMMASLCFSTISVSAETLADVLNSNEFKEAIASSSIGNKVDIFTDIKVKEASGGSYENTLLDDDFTGDSVGFTFKANLDMQRVRNKYSQYIAYANNTLLLPNELLGELRKVKITGSFNVGITMPEVFANSVGGMTNVTTPSNGNDLYGFSFPEGTLAHTNGISITDVYTEIDPSTNSINRTWVDEGNGFWTLTITLYPKSPLDDTYTTDVGYDPLTAGDLMNIGGTDPDYALYAPLDYNSYLSDIRFEIFDPITIDTSASSENYNGFAETIWGHIEGNTDFVYYDDVGTEDIVITDVEYNAVQKIGKADENPQLKPDMENHDIISNDISATVEFARATAKRIIFNIDGKYLISPAKSGVNYNKLIDPVYNEGASVTFDPDLGDYVPTGVKTNYSFEGWSLTPNGEVITDLTDFTAQSTNLYAVFNSKGGVTIPEKADITLSFVIDGDSTIIESISKKSPISIDLTTLNIPEKPGFKFDGWYETGEMIKKVSNDYSTSVTTTLFGKYVKIEAPSKLESDDHFAYIIGYPEGDVRPLRNVTREEVATIFYRLMKADYRSTIWTTENDFIDVESDRWSNNAISTMANGGYIKGYGDGNFRPDAPITRAEFVTIAARFLDSDENKKASFVDIDGHWAEEFIKLGVGNGFITGYEDNTFRPNTYITRAETMAIINRLLVRYVNAEGLHANTKHWPDNLEGAWYFYHVLEATNAHNYVRQKDEIYETWTEIRPLDVFLD
ncbi:MAG: S-layer homology domain-containing protein [Clostridia bacterium]|nr:S-layer homology domain-containing protein [Clostridia bacterium]